MGRAARGWRGTGAGAWGGGREGRGRAAGRRAATRGVLSLGVGLFGPEGASWEGRRFGTGPSFVRMTDGAGSSAMAGDWSGGMGPVAGGRGPRARRGFAGGGARRGRSDSRRGG